MAKCFPAAKHSVHNLFSARTIIHDVHGEVLRVCQAFCPNLFSAHTTTHDARGEVFHIRQAFCPNLFSAHRTAHSVHGKVWIACRRPQVSTPLLLHSASPSKWKENLCNSQFKGKNFPFKHRVHFYVNYSPKMFRSNTDYIFMQLTVQRCSIQTQITFLCNLQSKDVPFKCRLNYYVTYSPKMFCSNAHYMFV